MNIKQMLIILRFFSILAHSDLLRRKAPKSSRPSATRRRIRGSNGARWKDARSWRSCVWRQRQTNSDFERLAPRWIFCWRKEGRIWTAVTKFLLKMTRYILTGIPLVLIDLLFCFLPSLFNASICDSEALLNTAILSRKTHCGQSYGTHLIARAGSFILFSVSRGTYFDYCH